MQRRHRSIFSKGFEDKDVLAEFAKRTLCNLFDTWNDGKHLITGCRTHLAKIPLKALP